MYWLLLSNDARQLANIPNRYGSTPVLCASIIGGPIGSDMVKLLRVGLGLGLGFELGLVIIEVGFGLGLVTQSVLF